MRRILVRGWRRLRCRWHSHCCRGRRGWCSNGRRSRSWSWSWRRRRSRSRGSNRCWGWNRNRSRRWHRSSDWSRDRRHRARRQRRLCVDRWHSSVAGGGRRASGGSWRRCSRSSRSSRTTSSGSVGGTHIRGRAAVADIVFVNDFTSTGALNEEHLFHAAGNLWRRKPTSHSTAVRRGTM